MKNNTGSPEERLLRLIRKGRDAMTKGAGPAAKAPSRTPLRISSQKILAGILILAGLNFFYSLSYPFWALKSISLPQVPSDKSSGHKSGTTQDIRSLDEYLDGIRSHQIFSRAVPEDTAQPMANIDTDLAKDYALVGVIFGNDSQAIVQDKRSRQTIYLQKDQTLEGFKVYDIQEGKVVFDRNGERFELRV